MLKKSLLVAASLLLLVATPVSSLASVRPLANGGKRESEVERGQLFRMVTTASADKMVVSFFADDSEEKSDLIFDSEHYSVMVFGGLPGQDRNISFVDRDPEQVRLHGSFIVKTETFHALADYFNIIHAKKRP